MASLTALYWILGSNFVFSFILSLIVYIRSQKYYRPLIKKDKDNNLIDLHKKYDPFHPHDDVCFIQLWFGAFFCAFIKVISSLFIVIFVNWHIRIISKIYKNCDRDPEQRRKMKNAVACWSWMFLFINGVITKKKYPEFKDIYKKYLGENYDFNDDKYSLITSNHIGFFDVVLCMALYSPGFIAKKAIEDYFFIGPISSGLNCLFVDRESEKDKKKIFDMLLSRQKAFYEEGYLAPLVLFPEGTCSCGRNILRFKKGAFYSLLPVKPQIVSVDQKSKFHISVGASNVILHYAKNLCHFYNYIYVAILPTIRPTDFMFENYKHLGKEKWEIYANIVRKIYAEVGGIEETDMGLRDLKRYIKAMRTGIYDPEENIDYEKEKENMKFNEDNKTKENFLEINKNEILEKNDNNINNVDENKNEEKENIIEIKENKDFIEEKKEKQGKEEEEEDKEKNDIDNHKDNNEKKNEYEEKLLEK